MLKCNDRLHHQDEECPGRVRGQQGGDKARRGATISDAQHDLDKAGRITTHHRSGLMRRLEHRSLGVGAVDECWFPR
ncbi:MAG: hypothetical protein ACM3ZF_15330 [Mycobacterium leprae]